MPRRDPAEFPHEEGSPSARRAPLPPGQRGAARRRERRRAPLILRPALSVRLPARPARTPAAGERGRPEVGATLAGV
eukprot:scaffold395_cov383-Prasinococcus_capsulatus_cf.AAC.5